MADGGKRKRKGGGKGGEGKGGGAQGGSAGRASAKTARTDRGDEARAALGKSEYLERLEALQVELNAMARWLQATGKRLMVLVEGRDTPPARAA